MKFEFICLMISEKNSFNTLMGLKYPKESLYKI